MVSNASRDSNHEIKPVEDVDESTPLAHQVLPVRQAVIVASFPYRQEIEEFQRKLHLATPEDVLNEQAVEAEGGTQENSFRFEGVKVMRRTFDTGGKLLDDWKEFDLNKAYEPLLVATGARFQEEELGQEMELISPEGLVMGRLPDFSKENEEDKFPTLETQLKTISATLKTIKDAENIALPKSNIFKTDGLNVFKPNRRKPEAGAAPGVPPGAAGVPPGAGVPNKGLVGRQQGGRPGMPAMPPGMPGGPGMKRSPIEGARGMPAGMPPGMGAPLSAGNLGIIPEYCLIRVIDVTIEPGKVYEYKLQVVMANPNYKRTKEAASPSYAQNPTLLGKEYVVPTKVSVPPEQFIYAVDQKELDKGANKKYQGLTPYDPPDRDRYGHPVWTMLQVQKWVVDAGQDRFLGEWCVADRLPGYLGEYVGREEKIEVPVWDLDQDKFVLAADANARGGRRGQTGRKIDFNDPANPTILVDFEGGVVSVPRPGGSAKRLDEKCATEVLLLSDDGKLQCRNSATDSADKGRIDRLKAYQDRIKKVKEEDQNLQPQQGMPGNPFGGKGPGAGGGGKGN
jgi:hypothetical protein